jgi:hypothetical protein
MRNVFLVVWALCLSQATAAERELPLVFSEDFEKGAERWQPTDAAAWKITDEGGSKRYHQHQQSKVKTKVRSPFNYSLIKDVVVGDFVLDAKCKSTGKDNAHRDMCLFFGHQDAEHFYYVHIAKKADDRANQIFIVNNKDREKISKSSTDGTPWDDNWHHVRIVREVESGKIEIYFDDMKKPIMTAIDKTFTHGRVGLGSFDDTGMWDDVKLHGVKK